MSRYRSEMSCKRFIMVPLTKKDLWYYLIFLDIIPIKYQFFSLWTISNIMVLYLGTTTVHFVSVEWRQVPTLPALLFDSPPPTQPISPPNSPTFSPSALIFCPCCGFESLQLVKRTGCADSTASRITIHYSFVCVWERGVLGGGLYFQGSYYNYMTKCCKSHRVPNTGAGVRGQSTFGGVICKCHSGGLLCQSRYPQQAFSCRFLEPELPMLLHSADLLGSVI